jgi:NADH dehydrogenase
MRVAIVGGTGFVGSYLIDAMLAEGLHPVVLVRPGSEHRLVQSERCSIVSGDLYNTAAIMELLKDADAVIYNVGILREFPARGITFESLQSFAPRQVIDAAVQSGVKRFVLMSANGVTPDGTSYQHTKYAADQHLMKSGLQWAIMRPSVVFGDPRGRMEFASQLCDEIVRPPLPAPLFFGGIDPRQAGQFELSPVHVVDVASAFVRQLTSPAEVNRIFHLGGPQALSWQQILKTIAESIGKQKIMLPVPVLGVKLAASMLDGFEDFPVTRDQLTMLLQGNICGPGDLRSLGIEPRHFEVSELQYLNASREDHPNPPLDTHTSPSA